MEIRLGCGFRGDERRLRVPFCPDSDWCLLICPLVFFVVSPLVFTLFSLECVDTLEPDPLEVEDDVDDSDDDDVDDDLVLLLVP